MTNTQLSHAFAQGKTKGKGSNMFIDGDTIYSYGYHFPIAKRVDNFILINPAMYSNSTTKQQRHVARELYYSNAKTLRAPDCDITKAREWHEQKIIEAQGKLSRARLDESKNFWTLQIAIHTKELEILSLLGY